MFNVPRTQLVLLPYYSRLTAILSQYMKDVGTSLVAMVCIYIYIPYNDSLVFLLLISIA